MEISWGQAASHSPWLVQEPKKRSMVSTMRSVREYRSAAPWGKRLRWEVLAAVNNWAAELGQAATQAPHPMHAAASKAASDVSLGTGIRLASGAEPVATVMYPPASIIRSNAERSTTKSRITPNAAARQGSNRDDVPVLEAPHVELTGGRGRLRTVGTSVDHYPAGAADSFPAVRVEGNRIDALQCEPFVQNVQHLQKGHVCRDIWNLVGLEPALD